MKNPSIAVIVTHTALEQTQGKWLGLSPYLKSYGYRPLLVVWEQRAADILKSQNVPYLFLTLEKKDFDRIAEAEKLRALLDRSITIMEDAPTWGDLLVMDDWLGMSEFYEILGSESLRPDAIIIDYGGPESSTPEDEQMRLALWRFATNNNIPTLGVEIQTLDDRLRISRWPVDLLLTKGKAGRDQVQLGAPFRHFANFPHDEVIGSFLPREKELRQQLGATEASRYLLLPFHLYYTWECYQVLGKLAEQAEELKNKHMEVLVSCGSAFRRNLKEKDIILEGGKRWHQKIPKLQVVEGGSTLHWLLLAEACLIPYPSSNLKETCVRWGIPWYGLAETKQWSAQPVVTSPAQALAYLLEEKK